MYGTYSEVIWYAYMHEIDVCIKYVTIFERLFFFHTFPAGHVKQNIPGA